MQHPSSTGNAVGKDDQDFSEDTYRTLTAAHKSHRSVTATVLRRRLDAEQLFGGLCDLRIERARLQSNILR